MKRQNPAILLLLMFSGLLAACAGERPKLGVINGRLTPCPTSPNCVSSQSEGGASRILPLTFRDSPEQAFVRLLQLLENRGDTAVVEKTDDYLRVELRTTFFVDDAEFVLNPARREINVRSASRLGYSDLGLNRRRLEDIRREFSKGQQQQ